MEVDDPEAHQVVLDLMCPGSQRVTGLASGTPANKKEPYAHEFALTLSTIMKCDVPLPESCQGNNNELDASQWNAFRVSLAFFFHQSCSTLCRAQAYQYTSDKRLVEVLRLELYDRR